MINPGIGLHHMRKPAGAALRVAMAVLIAVALASTCLPCTAFAAQTDEDCVGASVDDAADTSADIESSEDGACTLITTDSLTLDEVVAQAKNSGAISTLSAETGTPDIVESDSGSLIDLFDLPYWALELYDALEEGADNDGTADFLIDPEETNEYRSKNIMGTTLTWGSTAADTTTYHALKIDVSAAGSGSSSASYESSCLQVVSYSFDHDHTEVFWTDPATFCPTSSGALYYVTGVVGEETGYSWLDEYTSVVQVREDIATRDTRVSEIVGELEPNDDATEIVDTFNTWLTTHNEYNTQVSAGKTYDEMSTKLPWECLSALDGRTGKEGPVCEGYARAFKVLCDTVGIDCVLVVGDAGSSQNKTTGLLADGESHMWNQVRMDDGRWYIVDVTWDDPSGGRSGAKSGLECADYVLIGGGTLAGGSEFWATHTATTLGKLMTLPASTIPPCGIAYNSTCALSDLVVSAGATTPAFDPYEVFYSMKISTALSPLTFTASAANASSTSVKVYTPSSKNGQDISTSFDAEEGDNYFWIRITPSRSSSSGGESYRITIEATSKMFLSQDTAEMVVGQQLMLYATPAAEEYETAQVTWSSSNTKVATVDATGLVTALGEGTATITAATDSNKATCTVKVGHTLSSGWTYNWLGHWHACATCDSYVGYERHTFGEWQSVREATTAQTGLNRRTCTVCGYTESQTIARKTLSSFSTADASYKVTGSDTVSYVSPKDPQTLRCSTIPATVAYEGKSYKVTSVAAKAFRGCTSLTKVIIGKKVRTIGKQAFSGCKKLKTVLFRTKVLKKIGSKAFNGCKKLKKFTLKSPKLAKKGVKGAFKGSSLRKVKTAKKLKKSYRKALTKKVCGCTIRVV